jgi:hypothetical protein
MANIESYLVEWVLGEDAFLDGDITATRRPSISSVQFFLILINMFDITSNRLVPSTGTVKFIAGFIGGDIVANARIEKAV